MNQRHDPHEIPVEDKIEAVRLFSEGVSKQRIAQCLGISEVSVWRLTKHLPEPVRTKPLTTAQRAHLLQGWGVGRSH